MYHKVVWQVSFCYFTKTLPRFFFLCQSYIVSQVVQSLGMWPKLTTHWLVSLSAIIGLSAIVYCEVSQTVNNG